MAYRPIVYEGDPSLTVYIDREQASANVRYSYDDDNFDDPSPRPTCYQTADMPLNDQAAARVVSDWLDSQS